MKKYLRRAAQAYPYYKLAMWDTRSVTFRDGKTAFSSRASARQAITSPGRYRISEVDEAGRHDDPPFDVG